MDNSLIELGHPLTTGQILKAAETVHARVVVLPDHIGHSELTVELADRGMKEINNSGMQAMGVVQGRNLDDCLWCAKSLVELGVDVLAVPRHLTARLGSRIPLVNEINQEYPHNKIHLLGFSDDILDDMVAAHMPNVWGIDSAVPIWCGLEHKRFEHSPSPVEGHRPDNYWLRAIINPEVVFNIARVNDWLAPVPGLENTPAGWFRWLSQGAQVAPTTGLQSGLVETQQRRSSWLEKLQALTSLGRGSRS